MLLDAGSPAWQRGDTRRPSLRRRLLLYLLVPMLVTLLLDAVVTYSVALAYANHVHDTDLAGDAEMVAALLKRSSSHGRLSAQARFMLEYDADGRDYYSVRNRQQVLVDGSPALRVPALALQPGQPPAMTWTRLFGRTMRVASIAIDSPVRGHDPLLISIAENLRARHRQARQILLLAVPLQALLMVVLLVLVRFGVGSGLKVLEPLTRRLARQERRLTPIDDSDVPEEMLPLTRTIDGLFARQLHLVSLHERFIADAAHQLRTPLAGLSLHVERARAHAGSPILMEALKHIEALTTRATRTANQLLALTRAQAPARPELDLQPVDLAELVRKTLELRLHEAWREGIDLGYEGPVRARLIRASKASLEEMLDNLLDNALRYAGRDGTVTVSLHNDDDGSQRLRVEDDGPGVDPALIPRLGERFFRDPSTAGTGTGLGLAIVGHIAERHGARVIYSNAPEHGLRVDILFASASGLACPD